MSPPTSDLDHRASPSRSRVSTAATSRGTTSSAALPWANGSFLADFRRDLNQDIASVTAAATATAKDAPIGGQQQQQKQQQRLTDWIKANPAFLSGTARSAGEHAVDYSFASASVSATDASFNFNLTSFLLDDRPRQHNKPHTKSRRPQLDSLLGTANGDDDSQIDNVRGELQALAARGSALAAAIGASDSFDQSLSLSTMFPVPPVPPALSVNNTRRTHDPASQYSHDDDDQDDGVLPSRPGQQAVPQHAYIGGRGFTSAEDADRAAVMYANPATRFERRPPLFPVPALDHTGSSMSTGTTEQEPGSPTPLATKSSKSPAHAGISTSAGQHPPRIPPLELDVRMGSTAALLGAVAGESSSSPPHTPRPQPQNNGDGRESQESTITGPPSSFLVAMQQPLREDSARPSTPQHAQAQSVATTLPPPPPRREAYVTGASDTPHLKQDDDVDDDDDDDLTHAHLLPTYPTMPRVVSTPKSKSHASALPSGSSQPAVPPSIRRLPHMFGMVQTPAPSASVAPKATAAGNPIPSPPSPSSPPTDPLYSHPPHELAHAVNQLTAQLRDVTAARDRLLDRVKAAEDDAARARAQLAGAQAEVGQVRDELAGVRAHLRVVDEDRERKAEMARAEAGKVGELKAQVLSLQRMVRELGDTVKLQDQRLRESEASVGVVRGRVLDPSPGSPPMLVVGELARRQVHSESRPHTPVADMQTQTPSSIATPNATTMATQYRVLRETSVQTDRRVRKDSASSATSNAHEGQGNRQGHGGGNADGDDDEEAKVRRARRKVLHAELQREMMRKLRAVAMRRLERERAAAASAVGEAYDLDRHQYHLRDPEPVYRPRSAPVSPSRVRVRGRSVDAAPVRHHDRLSDPSPRRHTESSRRKVLSVAQNSSSGSVQTAGVPTSSTARKPPFILGSNPGKSHSLPVNLQCMMSLAKIHAPGLCPHCHGDPHATSHRHPVATVVAHAIPATENSRRKLEEQQHVLHVELARLVRQSDASRDLKAKRDMHPVIQRVIRRLAELDRELEDMGVGDGCEHDEVAEQSPLPAAVSARPTLQQQHSRAASGRPSVSAASSPSVDRKKATGSKASSSGLSGQQRAADRPQLRNLSLLRSSQKVQQALLMGT